MILDIPITQKTSTTATHIQNWFQDFFKVDRPFDIDRFLKEEITAEFFNGIGKWSKEKYIRIKLFANDHCEVILLCWSTDQMAPKHNHDNQDCYVYSVDGVFEEKTYDCNNSDEIVDTRILNPQEVTQMVSCEDYHTLENKTGKPARSLHFYAQPINKCQVFCNDTNQFIERTLSYDYCISDFI